MFQPLVAALLLRVLIFVVIFHWMAVKKSCDSYVEGVIGNVTSFGTIGSKVVECQEKKVAQARLAPHECSNALAHTTRMRTGDGAALPECNL